MPERREPTERELAVQHYAEEVRRHELLADAIRVVENHIHRLGTGSQRVLLTALHMEIRDSMFHDLQQAFQLAAEIENK